VQKKKEKPAQHKKREIPAGGIAKKTLDSVPHFQNTGKKGMNSLERGRKKGEKKKLKK